MTLNICHAICDELSQCAFASVTHGEIKVRVHLFRCFPVAAPGSTVNALHVFSGRTLAHAPIPGTDLLCVLLRAGRVCCKLFIAGCEYRIDLVPQ